MLAEDANHFAQTARRAVTDDNSREQIEKDVHRTRPGLERFKKPAVRAALLRLLSLFCQRRQVAYIQGFNELLAPFILLPDTGGNPRFVYALFNQFMTRFAPWMLESSESTVFDVLKRLFKYFGRLLLYHDPELYWRLEQLLMTPDLYATSWFVTLFARNFTVESVLALWDLLLLEDNPLGTSFFGVALVCSKREQLLAVDESTIPETLMMLTAHSPEHVRTLWQIGSQMRTLHTPPSFQRLMTDRLLSTPGRPTRVALSAARAMQASVCLQTTPDDLVAGKAQYFTWDCRTEAEYNAGHLAQAAFLSLDALRLANGKISSDTSETAREELQHAVDMCEPLRNTSHICLIGSGIREEDNLDINMLALYLTRSGISYVSTLRGGFKAALEAAKADDRLTSVELVDYDRRRYDQARKERMTQQLLRKQGVDISPSPTKRKSRGARSSDSTQDGNATANHLAQAAPPSQGISSFLEKTDVEVSKALSRALNGIGFKYSLSSLSGAPSTEKDAWSEPNSPASAASSAASRFNPFSPNSTVSPTSSIATSGTNTPSKRRSVTENKHSNTAHSTNATPNSLSSSAWNGAGSPLPTLSNKTSPTNGHASSQSTPKTTAPPKVHVSPRPGLPTSPSPTTGQLPPVPRSPMTPSSFFGIQKSVWGRDAKPGWLGQESLSYPLCDMPKGYTVNIMDDRLMRGLTLFPCKAKSERVLALRGRTTEFKKRFVGVSEHYFLLLSPHGSRSHLMEVKLIRYLQHISRITFKRSRPELVTFQITTGPEDNETVESVTCIMPEGLTACVTLIKQFLSEDEDEQQSLKNQNNTSPTTASEQHQSEPKRASPSTETGSEAQQAKGSAHMASPSNRKIPRAEAGRDRGREKVQKEKKRSSETVSPEPLRSGPRVLAATTYPQPVMLPVEEPVKTRSSVSSITEYPQPADSEFGDFQAAPLP